MGFFVLFIDLFLFLTRGRWVEENVIIVFCALLLLILLTCLET